MFQTKAVEKIKTRILCSITFFSPISRRLGYDVEEMATDDNIIGASALHAG